MSKSLRKTLCVVTLGAGLSLGYLAWAGAPDDGEEPPPKDPVNDCSPGFWKNHPEYWTAQFCGSAQGCIDAVLANLTSQGKGSDALRHDQAATLNAWADTYYNGALVCPN